MDKIISWAEEHFPRPSIRIKKLILLEKEWRLCRLKTTGRHSQKIKMLRAECIAYWQRIHSLESLKGDGPPRLAKYLLQFILSEYAIGDLEEGYAEVKKERGKKRADLWYYSQVMRSAWPFIRMALRWVVDILIEEWIRRRL